MDDRPFTEAVPMLARLTDGVDRAAWEGLARLVGPQMRACAAAVAPAQADDAVQEVLVRLPALASRFRLQANAGPPGAQLRRWLGRIAVNAALDLRRAEQRRHRRERAIGSRSDELDHTTRIALADALAELPESARQAVVLRHVLGADDAELAQGLGCSPGAARVRLHRAIERLRRRLAPAIALAALPGLLSNLQAVESSEPLALALDRLPRLPIHHLTGSMSPVAKSACIAAALLVAASPILLLSAADQETTDSLTPAHTAHRISGGSSPGADIQHPSGSPETERQLWEHLRSDVGGLRWQVVSIERGRGNLAVNLEAHVPDFSGDLRQVHQARIIGAATNQIVARSGKDSVQARVATISLSRRIGIPRSASIHAGLLFPDTLPGDMIDSVEGLVSVWQPAETEDRPLPLAIGSSWLEGDGTWQVIGLRTQGTSTECRVTKPRLSRLTSSLFLQLEDGSNLPPGAIAESGDGTCVFSFAATNGRGLLVRVVTKRSQRELPIHVVQCPLPRR